MRGREPRIALRGEVSSDGNAVSCVMQRSVKPAQNVVV
jgi:hypothetical protein